MNAEEVIKKALIMAGARRAAARREIGCSIVESDFGDEVIITAIYEFTHKHTYLVKITPASKAYAALRGCEELKYIPYGLYVLLKSESDISRVVDKVRRVMKLREVWR